MRSSVPLFAALVVSVLSPAAAQPPAAPPPARTFDSAGVRIHYTDRGTGEPVVVLHGYAMNLTRMTVLTDALVKAGYRAIAVDERGHGGSDKPHAASAYGVEMAHDIVRLLDHLALPKAHLVGYSMGAIVSQKVRALHPDRLQTVVLGGGGWHEPGATALAGLTGDQIATEVERSGTFEAMLRKFTETQVPPPTDEDIRLRSQRMTEGNDTAALAAVMRGWNGFTVTPDEIRRAQVPMRAIVGGNDPLKAQVDALKRALPSLDVVVIPGADHGALSHPDFSAKTIEFLRRHPLTSAATGTHRD